MKIKKLNKNLGFSLVELTLTLAVFGTIILITTQIIEQVNVKKNINVQKEHITAYENSVIKKINANYDDLYLLASKASNQQLVYTYANFNDYAKNGGNNIESNISHSFFNPCVLIKADTARNTLSATLIYPANKTSIKNSAALSNELGNASWESSNKDLIGKVKTDYFTAQNIQALASSCNSKINSFESGSIFIDLNNNNNLTSKKSNITDNSINNGSNETLKNNNDGNSLNKTLGTNLYMDAIVKEATPWSTNYCDNNKAQTDAAAQIRAQCSNLSTAATRFDGMEKIENGVLSGNSCTYNLSANFTLKDTCNPNDANSAGYSACSSYNQNGYTYYDSFAYIGGTTTPDSTGMCSANYQARFSKITSGTPDTPASGTCSIQSLKCSQWGGGNYTTINCSVGETITYYADSLQSRGCWSNGPHTVKCDKDLPTATGTSSCQNYVPAQPGTPTTTDYQTYACATNTQYSGAYGSSINQSCGQLTLPAYNNSGITPPQHKFKGLVFNNNVLVKTGTGDGTSSESDVYLNVKNAGVKSGYVIIKSKYMQPDTQCKPNELGKILQQADENGNYTTSQLICSYDTAFCGDTGYCYSPLVSQTQFIINGDSKNPTPTTLLSCPAGLRADSSWLPSIANGGLVDNGNCFTTISGIKTFGVITPIQVNDGSKAIGYKSVCKISSTGTENNINALTKIKCTSASSMKTTTCERDANDQLQCQ